MYIINAYHNCPDPMSQKKTYTARTTLGAIIKCIYARIFFDWIEMEYKDG